MKDPDVHFVKFFYKVIEDEMEQNTSSTHKDCLKRVQRSQSGCANLCSSSSSMRCAYVYHHAPCLASTLHNHFAQLVASNTFLLQRIVLRQHFTVCCLSAGFTVDFIAITRVLESRLRSYFSSENGERRRIVIEIVVISTDSNWTSTIEKMAKKLSEDLAEAPTLDFNHRFLTADFTLPLTDDVKQQLLQSDIITMANFVSNISDQGSPLRVIQEIIPFIRRGGVLFYLDSPKYGDFNMLKEHLEDCDESFLEIYGPMSYSVQRIRLLCRIECIKLYSRKYGWRCCALENASCVGAWYKGTSECS